MLFFQSPAPEGGRRLHLCPSFFGGTGNCIFAGMITIRECLEIMHSGESFSLKVVSFDRRRKDKTGQVQEYQEAQLVWGDGGNDQVKPQGERPQTDLERALGGTVMDKRDPHHADWYTRNIRILQNGQRTEMLRKIHPALIIEFNGQTTCP